MKYLRNFFLYITIVLLVVEVALRFMGFETYKPIEFQANEIRVEPKPFFEKNDLLGYKMRPGKFKIFYPDSSYWVSTNMLNGNRITSVNSDHNCDSLPQINILGDSFTHGSGIADNETYPFLLQSDLPAYCINNYGVGGYGIVHAYLLLLNTIDVTKTKVVVYSYIGEHDNRHNLVVFKKMYPSRETLKEINFASIDQNLKLSYNEYNYKPLPLIGISALFNLIDDIIIKYKDQQEEKHLIAKKVLQEMNEYCNENNIKFVFAAISRDNLAKDMLDFCKESQILNIDISVDLNDNNYNLLPYDDHPNAFANVYFKNTLESYLVNEGIIDRSNSEQDLNY